LGSRKGIWPAKIWWDAGVVICLERGAYLHVAQLMPLPLIVSYFCKIQIGFTFLVPAHPGSPGRSLAVKWMDVMYEGLLYRPELVIRCTVTSKLFHKCVSATAKLPLPTVIHFNTAVSMVFCCDIFFFVAAVVCSGSRDF